MITSADHFLVKLSIPELGSCLYQFSKMVVSIFRLSAGDCPENDFSLTHFRLFPHIRKYQARQIFYLPGLVEKDSFLFQMGALLFCGAYPEFPFIGCGKMAEIFVSKPYRHISHRK